MTVLEDLKKTREVLETHGRTTGDLYNDHCEVCLLGAIGVAVGLEEEMKRGEYDPFREYGVARPVVDALTRHLPESYMKVVWDWEIESGFFDPADLSHNDLYQFNDDFASDEDVFALIDDAIAEQEAAA